MNATESIFTAWGSPLDALVFSFGALTWIVGSLQPAVAGYALRLARNFGTHRVGWWLFAAFSLLALGHLVQSLQAVPGRSGISGSETYIPVLVPLLLLIGMAHTESLFVERARLERKRRSLVDEFESKAQERIAAFGKVRDALLDELDRTQQEQTTLQNSERDFRLLFTSIPQSMWVFDLRTFQFLAVNNATTARYGFTLEELLARRVCDLLASEDVAAFLRDAARPACGAQHRGIWHLRTKQGSLLNVEIIAVDLRFGGCPARLILVSEVPAAVSQ